MVVMNIWRCALPEECHGRIFALCSRGTETVNCLIDACLTRAEQEAALWHEVARKGWRRLILGNRAAEKIFLPSRTNNSINQKKIYDLWNLDNTSTLIK